jgi:methylated-DNA-[protein]-cysteine S-methyltransferase
MNRKIIKSTPFGPVIVLWAWLNDAPRITRVILSRPGLSAEECAAGLCPDSQMGSCKEVDDVAADIRGFLEGDEIEFSLGAADMSACTDFQQRVLCAEHGIPRGKVSSYKHIACYLGKSGGARAVGNALATNPFPIIVPCHRAIRSDKPLGGYQGGVEMKRALLQMEGHCFDDAGRALCVQFHYGRVENERGNQ